MIVNDEFKRNPMYKDCISIKLISITVRFVVCINCLLPSINSIIEYRSSAPSSCPLSKKASLELWITYMLDSVGCFKFPANVVIPFISALCWFTGTDWLMKWDNRMGQGWSKHKKCFRALKVFLGTLEVSWSSKYNTSNLQITLLKVY